MSDLILKQDMTEKELEDIIYSLQGRLGEMRLESSGLEKHRERIASKGRPIHFVSFGFGAAGESTGHPSTRSQYLNSSGALKIFRIYSDYYNYYFGSVVQEGAVDGSKHTVLTNIKKCYSYALKLDKHFVLYYHGHGRGDLERRGN
eukprot:scaffold504_cov189-Ochromonas_danica.AAC.33